MDGKERKDIEKHIRGKIAKLEEEIEKREEEIGKLEISLDKLLRETIVIKGKNEDFNVSIDSIYQIRFDDESGLIVEFDRTETVISKEEAIRLINLLGW